MSFWTGVFAGIAVWNFVQLLLALLFYGETAEIDNGTVKQTFGFMSVAMVASWYFATFKPP